MNTYIQQLSNLNTARIAGKNAPHKAVLLLSIMDLIEIGDITNPRIELTERLEKTFNTVWKKNGNYIPVVHGYSSQFLIKSLSHQ